MVRFARKSFMRDGCSKHAIGGCYDRKLCKAVTIIIINWITVGYAPLNVHFLSHSFCFFFSAHFLSEFFFQLRVQFDFLWFLSLLGDVCFNDATFRRWLDPDGSPLYLSSWLISSINDDVCRCSLRKPFILINCIKTSSRDNLRFLYSNANMFMT